MNLTNFDFGNFDIINHEYTLPLTLFFIAAGISIGLYYKSKHDKTSADKIKHIKKSAKLICNIGTLYVDLYGIIRQITNYDDGDFELSDYEQSQQISEKLSIYLDSKTEEIKNIIKTSKEQLSRLEDFETTNDSDINYIKNNLNECLKLITWVELNFVEQIPSDDVYCDSDGKYTQNDFPNMSSWDAQYDTFVTNKNRVVILVEESAKYIK